MPDVTEFVRKKWKKKTKCSMFFFLSGTVLFASLALHFLPHRIECSRMQRFSTGLFIFFIFFSAVKLIMFPMGKSHCRKCSGLIRVHKSGLKVLPLSGLFPYSFHPPAVESKYLSGVIWTIKYDSAVVPVLTGRINNDFGNTPASGKR